MKAKHWCMMFLASVVLVGLLLAGLNFLVDPFGAFGDVIFQWWSYDETTNPRIAKQTYLETHHGEYDSYIVGCSSTSSFPVAALNEYTGDRFYNAFVYGADMEDTELQVNYLLDHYEVKNIVLNVHIVNTLHYSDPGEPMTGAMPASLSGENPVSYTLRYLFANPRYALAKLDALGEDTWLPQTFDVFDEATGEYDKRLRDIEPIGDLERYFEAYPEFVNYPSYTVDMVDLEETVESIARIKARCDEAGVNFLAVCPTNYVDYLRLYQPEQVEEFFRQLAQVTDFWDFSFNAISYDPRFFYDGSHFRNAVGEMMFAEIYGNDSVWRPEDFGTLVTAENVEEHLATYWNVPEPAEEDRTAQVPILCYHSVVEDPALASAYAITAEAFEAQIRALSEAGYVGVTTEELIAYVYEGAPLPDKPVLITFDDGYLDNYTLAYPILQKYNMKATIFAVGSTFGSTYYKDTDHAMTPHFGAEEAREMAQSGLISIQSHTYDFHQWAPYEESEPVRSNILPLEGEDEWEYADLVAQDFQKSRALLEEATGQAVEALAFPGGEHCELAEAVLRLEGVKLTVTTQAGGNTIVKGLPQSLYCLGRYYSSDALTPEQVVEMIGG